MIKGEDLVKQIDYCTLIGEQSVLELPIKDLCYNTEKAGDQIAFFALKGRSVDGSQYIEKAYQKGCRLFISETIVPIESDALLIHVKNSRYTLSVLSDYFFNHPSQHLKVIGVTGTKGKTTTTTLLYHVLKKMGIKAGVIGTNGIFFGNKHLKTVNTTPESYELHKVMRTMIDEDVEVCLMEVSSQGLQMMRVEHIDYDLAIFTNMAVDHIGELEHPTFEDYLYWKTHLFTLAKNALINADDPYTASFMTQISTPKTYSVHQVSDYQAKDLEHVFSKEHVGMTFQLNEHKVELMIPGEFNVYNALVVLGVCEWLELDIKCAIQNLKYATVSGRMEIIPNKLGILAVLDYAHNGFSLQQVVDTLKHYQYRRLIVLFGSVGDRTQGRRKELGDVVANSADIAVITSDNPGYEDPSRIIDDIKQSFEQTECIVYTQVDRRLAIEEAVNLAKKGDIVVFAGKGHETYQIIKDEYQPFNEKELIMQAFRKREEFIK